MPCMRQWFSLKTSEALCQPWFTFIYFPFKVGFDFIMWICPNGMLSWPCVFLHYHFKFTNLCMFDLCHRRFEQRPVSCAASSPHLKQWWLITRPWSSSQLAHGRIPSPHMSLSKVLLRPRTGYSSELAQKLSLCSETSSDIKDSKFANGLFVDWLVAKLQYVSNAGIVGPASTPTSGIPL